MITRRVAFSRAFSSSTPAPYSSSFARGSQIQTVRPVTREATTLGFGR